MELTPKELIKQYVDSQNFTSLSANIAAMQMVWKKRFYLSTLAV